MTTHLDEQEIQRIWMEEHRKLNGASPEEWDKTNKISSTGNNIDWSNVDLVKSPNINPDMWGKANKISSTGGSTSFYKIPEGATELNDLIEHKNMSFAVGNIFKAAYRLGEKKGITTEYDLNKIVYFANRELERLR